MLRIAGADVEEDLHGSGKDGFRDGTPGVEAATEVTDDWLNGAQEDLCRFAEAMGITLTSTGDDLKNAVLQALQGAISYSLTADVDDVAPTGHSTAQIIKVTSSFITNDIRGLSASSTLKSHTIVNVGSVSFNIGHEVGSSVAANRFTCPGAVDYLVAPGEAVRVVYDATTSRWRVLAGFALNKSLTFTGTSYQFTSILAADIASLGNVTVVDEYHFDPPTGMVRYWPAAMGWDTDHLVATPWARDGGQVVHVGSTQGDWYFSLNGHVPADASLTSVRVHYTKSTAGTFTFALVSSDPAVGGSATTVESDTMGSGTNTSESLTLSGGDQAFAPETTLYWLKVTTPGTATDLVIHSFRVDYDMATFWPA